ncbi:MAG: hydroxymethylglutaryl-CoA lyase [Ruthenibacterium sp.]
MQETEKKKVKLVDVGPRDGFQNVKEFIPTEFKLEIIDGLVKAGYKKIQCTSFVSPKAIAQMQDAAEIGAAVLGKYPGVDFFALVPNYFGAQAAVKAGFREITPVMSLSVSHNQSNVRRTHAESIEELARIRQDFPDLKITQDIATVFGCPFEGKMEIPPLIELLGKLNRLGITAFTLCDTIGVAYPDQVKAVLTACRAAFPDCEFNLHIHDTRNMGILNSYTGVLCGADSIQTAVGGLGGCPFAPGATGNTSSEDFVYMLQQQGYETGIDFDLLLAVAKKLHSKVEGNYSGHHINITINQCGYQ